MNRAELERYGGVPSIRCHAHSKRTGEPCGNWAMQGQEVCRMHGGSTGASRRKAAARIEASLDRAAAAVVKLMEDDATPHGIKLAAARDLLDRGGLGVAAQAETQAAPWQMILQSIIVTERSGEAAQNDDVIQGQVVDSQNEGR